jgi:hypothetical protein
MDMISPAAQSLLETFDRLSPSEKHEVMIEIVRRTPDDDGSALSGEDMAQVADELFVEMDRRENQP